LVFRLTAVICCMPPPGPPGPAPAPLDCAEAPADGDDEESPERQPAATTTVASTTPDVITKDLRITGAISFDYRKVKPFRVSVLRTR
jgi:hypothetical protein